MTALPTGGLMDGGHASIERPDPGRLLISELDHFLLAVVAEPADAPDQSIARTFCEILARTKSRKLEILVDAAVTNDPNLFLAGGLRLLDARPQAVTETDLGRLLVSHLRSLRQNDFWKRVSDNPQKAQTHEILMSLRAAVSTSIRDLEQTLRSSLGRSPQASCEALMKAFGNPVIRTVAAPFVAWNKAELEDLYRYAADCLAHTELGLFRLFDEAATRVLDRLDRLHTHWSLLLKDSILVTIAAVRDAVDETGRLQPATLTVTAVHRRLPLDLPGQSFRLPVTIANLGPGVAFLPRLKVETADGLVFAHDPISMGDELPPGSVTIDIRGDVGECKPPSHAAIMFELEWNSFSGEVHHDYPIVDVMAQKADVDWDHLDRQQPYSLDAVESAKALYGRKQWLRQLRATLMADTIGSFFIYGQKRVGKTSLAKSALAELAQSSPSTVSLFRDIGSINNADPARAVDALVERLVEDLRATRPNLRSLGDPVLKGSIAPLCRFIELAVAEDDDLRVVIALDEFDRLPVELLQRTPEGDAFFTGLRSMTALPKVGVILIGGERMKLILNGPGVELNKFTAVALDYIDRTTSWSDFVDLVRDPVSGVIDFDDDAVDAVYQSCRGNPYYAKLILKTVYDRCIENRTAWVIGSDVSEAISRLVSGGASSLAANSFSHYWEDYLLERRSEADAVTLRRRRTLLALADSLRESAGHPVPYDTVLASCSRYGLHDLEARRELEQFRQRNVLWHQDGSWSARLPLFKDWLVARGSSEIVMNESELDAESELARADEAQRVAFEEADQLSDRFGVYQGRRIGPEQISTYLSQFGSHSDQRLIFDLLKRVKYYSAADSMACARAAWDLAQVELRARGGWSRERALVTYVDGPGKSQQYLARDLAIAMQASPSTNVVDHDRLVRRLKSKTVDAVLLLDDFVGTGESLSKGLIDLLHAAPALRESDALVGVFAITGFESGVIRVEEALRPLLGDRLVVRCLDVQQEDQRALAVSAFASPREHQATVELVRSHGERLDRRSPLGFGDCAALVVFDRSTPNCSLPILWKSGTAEDPFTPLFPRYPRR